MKSLACDSCGRELEPDDARACMTCNLVLCWSCYKPCRSCGGEMYGPANFQWLRINRRITGDSRSPRCDRCKNELEYRPPESEAEEEAGQETWWGDYCRKCNILLCPSCRDACPTCGTALTYWPAATWLAQVGKA